TLPVVPEKSAATQRKSAIVRLSSARADQCSLSPSARLRISLRTADVRFVNANQRRDTGNQRLLNSHEAFINGNEVFNNGNEAFLNGNELRINNEESRISSDKQLRSSTARFITVAESFFNSADSCFRSVKRLFIGAGMLGTDDPLLHSFARMNGNELCTAGIAVPTEKNA